MRETEIGVVLIGLITWYA